MAQADDLVSVEYEQTRYNEPVISVDFKFPKIMPCKVVYCKKMCLQIHQCSMFSVHLCHIMLKAYGSLTRHVSHRA